MCQAIIAGRLQCLSEGPCCVQAAGSGLPWLGSCRTQWMAVPILDMSQCWTLALFPSRKVTLSFFPGVANTNTTVAACASLGRGEVMGHQDSHKWQRGTAGLARAGRVCALLCPASGKSASACGTGKPGRRALQEREKFVCITTKKTNGCREEK